MSKNSRGKSFTPNTGGNPPSLRRGPWWLLGQKEPIAGFTAWLSVFTLLLVGLGGLQAYSFIESERSYLVASDIKILKWPTTDDTHLPVQITLKNGGKETAFITGGTVTALVTPKDERLSDIPAYSEKGRDLRGPVLPSDTLPSIALVNVVPQIGPKWSQEQTASIQQGTKTLYLYGYVDYDDGFSWFRSRKTGFCFRYNANPYVGNGNFVNCSAENYVYAR